MILHVFSEIQKEVSMDLDKTMSFNFEKEKNAKTKEILKEVYEALVEKGYKNIQINKN